ncbi:MAG: hypothetical protein ACI4VI_09710 [Acutalibacteraceae bacterium]
MINFIREREWLYRSLRTFLQAFISTLSAQLMLGGVGEIDKKVLFSALVSSLAAGLAAVMNAKPQGDDTLE